VRSHDALRETGDLHDGAQLSRGELLVDRVVQFRQHTAGSAHLDEPGTYPKLLTGRPSAVGRPVGEPSDARHAVADPVERKRVEVRMAARRGQDRAGAVDGRAGE